MRFHLGFLSTLTDGPFPHQLRIESSPHFSPRYRSSFPASPGHSQLRVPCTSAPTPTCFQGPGRPPPSLPDHLPPSCPGFSPPGLAAWDTFLPPNPGPAAAHLPRPSDGLVALSERRISWDPPQTPGIRPLGRRGAGVLELDVFMKLARWLRCTIRLRKERICSRRITQRWLAGVNGCLGLEWEGEGVEKGPLRKLNHEHKGPVSV